ncbi:MAG: hypothetical protein MUF24_08770 [Chitinophagaceae bacterium]|nr:hypothetical protein [Chitinophagaceae bacterium]
MKKLPSIWFCLVMDVIGMLTFTIPFLGEFADLVWAPVSAFVFYFAFGGKRGLLGAMFNFMEEILPFLDFVPTFTIAWFYFRYLDKNEPQNMILPKSGKQV